jgi:anti-sigma regulatory factor (Ser/Thr protein kinase)
MTALRVRFATDPASVPGARRFVSDGLASWGLEELVEDVSLCVTELAANAALHSAGSFMSVVLTAGEHGVRVSVEDDGPVPTAAVAPRADFAAREPVTDDVRDEPTTGRGLAIVDVLATSWGVEDTAGGKRVWAQFGATAEPPEPHPAPPADARLPEGWVHVRLAGCPVRLSLRQDEHLDELVREMQLLSADHDNERSQALAAQIQGLLHGPAHARHTGRRQAVLAQEAGLDVVDVDMAMPAESSVLVRELQDAVAAADRLCEERRLLTLASTPDVRALRAWMTEELVAQIEHGRAPVSWSDWCARQDVGR